MLFPLFPEKIVEVVAEIVFLGIRNKRNKCLYTLQDFSGKERRKYDVNKLELPVDIVIS